MSDLKTKENEGDVHKFIDSVDDEQKRRDSYAILEIMADVSNKPAKMWGKSIVGFGRYHYKYASGREGDWPAIGFSPRKQNLTLYIMDGFSDYTKLLKQLGKHKTGVSCLYIKKLEDVDMPVLKQIIRKSFNYVNDNWDVS